MELDGPDGPTTRAGRNRRAANRYREIRAVRETVRLPLNTPRLAATPRGRGDRVIAIPGLGTGDPSLAPMRWFLRSRGHDCVGWGLGTNTGDVNRFLDRMLEVVDRNADETGTPVSLIGWSLGGVLARELARDRPDRVRRVITFGTPLHGPRNSVAARIYGPKRIDDIEAQISERNRRPIPRPITAIHSRNDGVVDWTDCIDSRSPDVENLRVASSHFGMGIDPDVWSITARRLAKPA